MLGNEILAKRTDAMGASAIREILKVVAQPGMISLAGGIPAPESFPLDLVQTLTDKVVTKYGASAFQYDATEGFGPLREVLVDHLAQKIVIYIGTLSKIFAPGLRVGFCVAPMPLRSWLVIVKQGIDLHTSTFNQALSAEYLSGGYLKSHLPKIIQLYRPRQEAMLKALGEYFPSGCRWTRPDGGMFIWVQGPEEMDMEALYWKALERKVAFVPGTFFYARKGQGRETMRLNFTMADKTVLSRAVRVLGQTLQEHMNG